MSVYLKAVVQLGRINQIHKSIEELSELIRALSRQDFDNISEEMADVYIMMEQLKLIYNNEKQIQLYTEQKCKKLNKMSFLLFCNFN
jgi:NTP pyrophosphatase (non-canonical NTP hydrolase)